MKFFIASLILHLCVLGALVIGPKGPSLVVPKTDKLSLAIINPVNSKPTKKSGDALKAKLQRRKESSSKAKTSKVKRAFSQKTQSQTKLNPFKSNDLKTNDSKLKNELTSKAAAKGAQLTYAQELKLFIEKNKNYPRSAARLKQSGTVRLKIDIDRQGNFQHIKLIKASPFPLLDQAALQLIKRLKAFKPPPKNMQAKAHFTIPIAYVLGERR